MKIIGTNLNKISFERNNFEKPVKLGKISNNVQLVDVKEKSFPAGKCLTFEFSFVTDYNLEEPKDSSLGKIEIEGEVVSLSDDKERKEILASWKKKKLEPKTMELVLNIALEVSQIEAISSSKKVLLPTPVRLPMFKLTEKDKGA